MLSYFLTYLQNIFVVDAAADLNNSSVFYWVYTNYLGDLFFFLPEVILVACIILILGVYVFQLQHGTSLVAVRKYILIFIALFVLLFLFYVDLYNFYIESGLLDVKVNTSFFSSQMLVTSYSFLLKLITVFFAIVFFSIAYAVVPYYWYLQVEHFCLFAFAIFGSLILASANDLLTFYLALEVSTIPLYILVSAKARSNFSTEGGLKYFIMGSFSSGLILFGSSYLYGFTGLTSFSDFAVYMSFLELGNGSINSFIILGFVLFISGLFIKIGIAPFHLWVVDVYAGAPILVTFFMMTVPKVILWGVSYKLVVLTFGIFFSSYVSKLLLICVVASFVFGIFPGLYQIKIKRLVIYSSIAANGFFLIPFFTGEVSSLYTYLIIYLITVSGFFAFYFSLRNQENLRLISKISELNNLSQVSPLLAYSGSLLLFSMAGIPPFAGFLGKFYLFINTFYSVPGLIALSLFFGCASTFYYIRLSKWMFFANTLVPSATNSWLFLVQPSNILIGYLLFAVSFNLLLILWFNQFISVMSILF